MTKAKYIIIFIIILIKQFINQITDFISLFLPHIKYYIHSNTLYDSFKLKSFYIKNKKQFNIIYENIKNKNAHKIFNIEDTSVQNIVINEECACSLLEYIEDNLDFVDAIQKIYNYSSCVLMIYNDTVVYMFNDGFLIINY